MSADPGTIVGEGTLLTDKAWRGLQARCALAGAALERTTDDRERRVYVVSRGAWTATFRSVGEIEGWLRLRAWVVERTGATG